MTYQKYLTALVDPTRREIFEKLLIQPSPVGRLADQLPVSRPAVSQHLKVLSDAGLVNFTSRGTRRIYAANPEAIRQLRSWLDGYWTKALEGFAAQIHEKKG